MNNKNDRPGSGSSGMKEISQMSMGGGVRAAGKPARNNVPDIRQYKKPALFVAAGLLVLVLLVVVVKALSGGRYSRKDYEDAAMLIAAMPFTEEDLETWKDGLKGCYPPEAEKVLDELYSGGESFVEMMEEMEEEDAEGCELYKEMLVSLKVSDSRMLDGEECGECEELIEKYYGAAVEIDDGCLVEVEMAPGSELEKKLEELEIDLEAVSDVRSIILVLRSGKYLGPWASSSSGLKLDEVTNLRRDLEW